MDIGAWAMPLAVLLIAAQLWLLAVAGGRRWTAAALGLLARLAVMNRFDFLPAAVGVVMLAAVTEGRLRSASRRGSSTRTAEAHPPAEI